MISAILCLIMACGIGVLLWFNGQVIVFALLGVGAIILAVMVPVYILRWALRIDEQIGLLESIKEYVEPKPACGLCRQPYEFKSLVKIKNGFICPRCVELIKDNKSGV